MSSFIHRLDTGDAGFSADIQQLLETDVVVSKEIREEVARIVQDVREEGDKALIRYTNELDARSLTKAEELSDDRMRSWLSENQIQASIGSISTEAISKIWVKPAPKGELKLGPRPTRLLEKNWGRYSYSSWTRTKKIRKRVKRKNCKKWRSRKN